MLERHGASLEDVRARRDGTGVRAALAELRGLAERRLGQAEALVGDLPASVVPAFVPLGTVRLDLARLRRAPRSVRTLRRAVVLAAPMGAVALGEGEVGEPSTKTATSFPQARGATPKSRSAIGGRPAG